MDSTPAGDTEKSIVTSPPTALADWSSSPLGFPKYTFSAYCEMRAFSFGSTTQPLYSASNAATSITSNAAEDEKGLLDASETIDAYLETAQKLLNAPGIAHEGYYAFVCEKCAPTFEYYGYFIEAEDLRQEAERIHARN